MDEVTLVADMNRPTGKGAARQIRRDGKVPAVMYGLGTDPLAVAVPSRELQHILSGPGGANTLISLEVAGEKELVLARQIQRHPVRHTLVHVDLIRVSRDTAVSAEVPIHLVGEASGVKDGGVLEQMVFTLSIEAKPQDLPQSIVVDISALTIGDHLSVADLDLPRGVTSTQEADEQIVHVVQPKGMALPEEEAPEGVSEDALPESGETQGEPAAEGGEG